MALLVLITKNILTSEKKLLEPSDTIGAESHREHLKLSMTDYVVIKLLKL